MVVNNLNLQHEVIWVVPCWLMAAAVQQGGDAEGYGGKASVNWGVWGKEKLNTNWEQQSTERALKWVCMEMSLQEMHFCPFLPS